MSWNDFRRNALEQQEQINERSSGGTVFMPWQLETFTIQPGQTGELRFLMPTEGGPFLKYYHWPKGGYPHACTAMLEEFDEKCIFCHYHEMSREEARDAARAAGKDPSKAKSNSSMYQRMERVLEVIDFRYFHVVPHAKKEGKLDVALCGHDSKDLPSRVRCSLCRSNDEDQAKRWFGGHKVWELNKTNWATVWGLNEGMGRTCINVEDDKICGKDVYPVSFVCGECGHEYLDDGKLQGMSDKDIAAHANNRQQCPECDASGFPQEVAVCDSGTHEPQRAMIFDKNFVLSCQGEPAKFSDGTEYVKKNLNFDTSPPFSHVAGDIAQHGFSEEEIEGLITPMDLPERYKPERKDKSEYNSLEAYVADVLKTQASSINKPVPNGWIEGEARSESFGGARQGGTRSFRRS
jgi:hypothetical protein